MLPITVILILLMRIDGMLLALRLQQRDETQRYQYGQQFKYPTYIEENEADPIDDVVNEKLVLSLDRNKQDAEAERIKRCILFKYGLSETMDLEDRDIMKDARTSFLPQDTTVIPRECLEMLIPNEELDNMDDYQADDSYLTKRSRRTPFAQLDDMPGSIDTDKDAYESVEESIKNTDYASFIETTSALQSYWNKEGTKDSIRHAQANSMKKYMDTNANPCNDFYQYACGNWERLHPIPRDKAGFDTFEMLRENLDIVLKQLLEANEIDGKSHTKKKEVKNIDENDKQSIKTAALEEANMSAEEIRKERERLKRNIMNHGDVLRELLLRYKRQTTNTKRKRLLSLFGMNSDNSSKQKTVTQPPIPMRTEPIDARLKAKYLYQSCVNTQLLQKRGIEPLLDLIKSFGGWPVLDQNWRAHNFDWLNLTAQLRRYNNDIFIVEWVGPDIKNSDENVIQFDQTSLGLPTREYFLQDANFKYLQAYQNFMTDVLHKLGAPRKLAEHTAIDLINFETQLAAITSPAELRLNVTNLYKRMTLKELNKAVPRINWIHYLTILQARNVKDTEQVVIYAIDYMQNLVSLLEDTKPDIIANYLMWRFVRHRINNVDDRFENIKQNFYHKLFGREESPSRWKICIAQVNTNMGMALGSMFVTKYFDEQSKRDTLKMTHELQQAFREILKKTDWLDVGTKRLAELKVNEMSLKIGYPDFILNAKELNEKYIGIDIHPDMYFENTLNVLLHTAKTEQNKLFEPVNKTTWQTAPAIVNAYYSRNKNQIMFPAGILQPPFYHRHFPRSMNFGGIGVVIGHELTHGFDDKGRLFDRHGNIHKWWTDNSIKGFDQRAQCIIAQYSNYTVGEVGIALNGESTQGENIADNGGIRQAFHAYKRWLHDNPLAAADERLPGLDMTGEQLFFLNFGQVWCGAMRPEAVRNKLNTAIHSPGRFRVIGTLSNSPDFAREFHCPVGSPMNPVQKCMVW